MCFFEQILETTPVQPLSPSDKTSNLDKQDMLDITGDVRMNSSTTFSDGLLNMDITVLADQQEFTLDAI